MEMYAGYYGNYDFPISTFFWGFLIFVVLVASVILTGRALEWLHNRKKPGDEAVLERGHTEDWLTETLAEVWHSDQQRRASKERRKRMGEFVNHCADGNAPVLAHDVWATGTIFAMKLLPQIYARNRMRPAKPARKQSIAAVAAAAVWVLSLGAPAAVNADIPCRQWRFNGYTQFNFQDGRKMQFEWFGPWIPEPGQETIDIPPNGGGVGGVRFIYGGVKDSPNGIWMKRHATYSPDRDVSWFNGGVADDGFAYGITWDASGNYSSSWRSAEPLRCADDGG